MCLEKERSLPWYLLFPPTCAPIAIWFPPRIFELSLSDSGAVFARSVVMKWWEQ